MMLRFARACWVACVVAGLPLSAEQQEPATPHAMETESAATPEPVDTLDDALMPAPEIWTREQAKAWALEHNERILGARASIQRETGRMWSARSRLLPRVSLNGSYQSRDRTLIDRSPQDLEFPANLQTAIAQSSYSASVEVRQVLFDGFASWKSFRSALRSLDEAVLVQRDSIHRVLNEVDSAFDQILAAQQALKFLESSLALQERLLEIARKREAAGGITPFEVIQAEELVARGEFAVLGGEEKLTQAVQRFSEMLQLRAPQMEIDADGAFVIGDLELAELEISEQDALSIALAENVQIRAAEMRREKARLDVEATRSGIYPRVEAFSSYTARSSYYDVNREVSGVTVGVQATWNIFDGFNRRGQLLARLADRSEAEMATRAIRVSVEQAVAATFSTYEAALSRLKAADKLLELSTKGYEEASRLFELGSVDVQRVVDAQYSMERARLSWLDAIMQHNNAVYQIRYLTALSEGVEDYEREPEEISDEAGLDNQQTRERLPRYTR